jgi:hypothetical protein
MSTEASELVKEIGLLRKRLDELDHRLQIVEAEHAVQRESQPSERAEVIERIRQRRRMLEQSVGQFPDSVELIREDRQR